MGRKARYTVVVSIVGEQKPRRYAADSQASAIAQAKRYVKWQGAQHVTVFDRRPPSGGNPVIVWQWPQA